MSQSPSISEYFYEPSGPEGHRCGYCGSEGTNVCRGMWTHHLTCEDYLDLIDRGWRRSGKYCYKPDMAKTCCPLYAIRCRAIDFRLSKSQKKVLKTMNSFLLRGERSKAKPEEGLPPPSSESGAGAATKDCRRSSRSKSAVRPGVGPDPSKPPCRKAKALRKERRLQRLGMAPPTKNNDTPASIGASSSSSSPPAASTPGGSGRAAKPATKDGSGGDPTAPSRASFMDVDSDGRKPVEMFLDVPASDLPPAHRLELELVRSSPPSERFKATFKTSHALFQKYQMSVHGDSRDKCDEKQFRRFLCDSPLIPVKGERGWPCDYGSYHQHYTLDGRLIMVAVFDILPICLSSVYVFYDPDFSFLSLGVYSALRELEMTRRLYLSKPAFEFYYMGYYVHSCQKMRYKGNYTPSSLLCPETYRFVPIEQCRPKLDLHKYSRLLDEEGVEEEEASSWFHNSRILFQHQAMPYEIFRALCGTREDAKVTEYAGLVGPRVASRMLLYLTADGDW